MNTIRKIWNDPVWSKIISVSIIGLFTLLFAFIKSWIEKTSLTLAIAEILNYKISLLYVILILLIVYFTYLLFKKISGPSRAQKAIKKYNSELNEEKGLMLKWDVEFQNNGKPYVNNIQALCTKHGVVPLQFYDRKCPVENCENAKFDIDYQKVFNHITSYVMGKV